FVSAEENEKFYRVYLDFLAQATKNNRYREINARFYQNCASISKEILMQGAKEKTFVVNDFETAGRAIRTMIDGYMIQWMMTGDHS
ncbi:TetR family transcriptional regulator C-terminal domain-containing protein, partial [Micrococcus sp. SIMBA_144]